jgi:hypothetical protein
METVDAPSLLQTSEVIEYFVLGGAGSLRRLRLFCSLSKRRCLAPQLLHASLGILQTQTIVSDERKRRKKCLHGSSWREPAGPSAKSISSLSNHSTHRATAPNHRVQRELDVQA